MNKLIISLLLPFYFILYSCSGSEKYSITISNEFIVPSVKGYHNIYFYDSLSNQEYIAYFSAWSKEDSLKVFEYPSINKLYSIPMYGVWDTLNGIQLRSFTMLSKDTFCISAEDNIFLFLNKNGDIYNYLDMSPYSNWKNLNLYYNLNFKQPKQSSTKKLYFKISAEPHDTVGAYLNNALDKMVESEYARYSAPNYCLVEMNGGEILHIEHYIPDIRNRIVGKGNYLTIGSNDVHLPINDKYYFATKHRDTIYEILWSKNEIVNKYKVKSKYTSLGIVPCRYDEVGISGVALQSCETPRIFENGYIDEMQYFPDKKVFAVLVFHELRLNPNNINNPFQHKNASILILNEKFELKTEYYISSKEYVISPVFTKDGFYMRKRGDTQAKVKDENYTYTVFNIN